MSYVPPLEDMRFVIEDVLGAPEAWRTLPAFAELDADTARAVLDEAGRFAAEVLAPLNGPGDAEGCRWHDGQVTTPAGFREAYSAFVAGGWPALACAPDTGGQGLPLLLNTALYEMLNAANHAWTMAPGLSHGAYECLRHHATPELRERYLPPIVSGQWLATMCLTEPQAGSDLGLLRTRAVPQADGSLAVTGSKIFISGGEHELSDNIVHLVLARLPDAPAGSKGLSLLLVPKVLPDGRANAVRCSGIEKKMGLKGSPTCTMDFDAARGWLIGQPNQGLAAMFLMMNAARLLVALQGVGHLDAATQAAQRYAQDRRQGRARGTPADAAPDPITRHPAVARTLQSLQARTDAARVIAYWGAMLIDEAEHATDGGQRRAAGDLAALLTPVAKAFLTAAGFQGASDALQVFGGHGYIHDHGIEQRVRDSRIALIYEGTNEIQAIDLVQRKLLADGGERFARLLQVLQPAAAACDGDAALAPFALALRQQIDHAAAAAASLVDSADDQRALRVADDFLAGTGWLLSAWAWARCATAALRRPGAERQARLARAHFGMAWLLPQAQVHWQRVLDAPLIG